MKKNDSTRKMVLAALFAALTFVATLIHIHVPGMQTGYVNLGDCLVIISSLLLGPVYGAVAGGIGSALTDLVHGYVIYVPATFVIKTVMGLVVFYVHKGLAKKGNELTALPVAAGGIMAELLMIGGYFLYEGLVIVGFAGAALGIFGNCIQGIFGVVGAVILLKVIKKTKIMDMI